MKLEINHTTVYRYDEIVNHSVQYLRLMPQSYDHQVIHSWQIKVPGDVREVRDGYGNIMHVMTLDTPHEAIELSVSGEVELHPHRHDPGSCTLCPDIFLRPSMLAECDQSLMSVADQYISDGFAYKELEILMSAILAHMPYQPGSTHSAMTAAQAWQESAGVCQDHSHVLIAMCRYKGIPARYVSGYIYTDDNEHVAMHAWCEVWMNDGWQMADITNGHLSPERHLKLAIGSDYLDAGPVRGVRFGGGEEYLSSVAQVSRVGAQ